MFSEGHATLPKGGIEEIPKQLLAQLQRTKIHYNTKIDKVEKGNLFIDGLATIEGHFSLIATEADQLVANLRNQQTEWKKCDCIYFECEKRIEKDAIIGLVSNEGSLINNYFFHSSLESKQKGRMELLSVTVVKNHELSVKELIKQVELELETYCNIKTFNFLKHYSIPKALPNLTQLQYDVPFTETQLTEHIFLAGDQLLNASLNAAMLSGERAAEAIINSIEGKSSISNFTSEYQTT
jgi:protoporphyrinogen oxidase